MRWEIDPAPAHGYLTRMSQNTHITVGGAPEGFDAKLLVRELESAGRPVIHVARDDKRLAAMRAALAFFAPDAVVLTLPGWDCLPFDRMSPNAEVSAARMATLAALAHGVPGPFILLTTLSAATQRMPARAVLKEASFTAQVGQRVDEASLRNFLTRMGFSQSPTVMEPGDFAIRGIRLIAASADGRAETERLKEEMQLIRLPLAHSLDVAAIAEAFGLYVTRASSEPDAPALNFEPAQIWVRQDNVIGAVAIQSGPNLWADVTNTLRGIENTMKKFPERGAGETAA